MEETNMQRIKCILFHSNWEAELWSDHSANIGVGVSNISANLRVEQRSLSDFHKEIKSARR